MLELVDIHTYYGESHVLWGISLRLAQGQLAAILGRNGMGKTTIIHSVIGFTPPRSGRVIINNRDTTGLKPYKIPQMGVALVPQGRRIFSSLSVKENLTVAASRSEQRGTWSLDRVYALFPILRKRAGNKGNLLSGGEQQMLCIGRALMTNPELLLMDEPSEGLAPLIIEDLGRTILQLNKEGLCILLAEQNISLAFDVASYIYVINKGTIVYQSTPTELRQNEEVQRLHIGVSA